MAKWLDRLRQRFLGRPPLPPIVLREISQQVAISRNLFGVSDTYKRHRVFRKVTRQFPDLPVEDIRLAIDTAPWE